MRTFTTTALATVIAIAVMSGAAQAEGFGPQPEQNTDYVFGNGFSVYFNGAAAVAPAPSQPSAAGSQYTHSMAQGDLQPAPSWQSHNYQNSINAVPPTGYGLKWVGN
jgi:hypothetical protein